MFNLHYGKNIIVFRAHQVALQAEIFLYGTDEKIIISDMDGTMTKTDIKGLYNNCRGRNYLHDGYQSLMNEFCQKGYRIVWITMRSIALYNFSKKYIQ
jgi:phosphatidate phosphatase LPIN